MHTRAPIYSYYHEVQFHPYSLLLNLSAAESQISPRKINKHHTELGLSRAPRTPAEAADWRAGGAGQLAAVSAASQRRQTPPKSWPFTWGETVPARRARAYFPQFESRSDILFPPAVRKQFSREGHLNRCRCPGRCHPGHAIDAPCDRGFLLSRDRCALAYMHACSVVRAGVSTDRP